MKKILDFRQFESQKHPNRDEMMNRLEKLHNELVPDEGKSETVKGEVVRAANRILYRWYNDGDMYFYYYGKETVGPSLSYLIGSDDIPREYRGRFLDLSREWEHCDEKSYWGFVDGLCVIVTELLDSGTIENMENTTDSRFFESRWDPNDDTEDYDDEEDY